MEIATYNIWNSNKGMPLRQQYIINEIRTINADILCMQEIQNEKQTELIKKGMLEALNDYNQISTVQVYPPYKFEMILTDGFIFGTPDNLSWKGSMVGPNAIWEAPCVEIGLEIFNYVRQNIERI